MPPSKEGMAHQVSLSIVGDDSVLPGPNFRKGGAAAQLLNKKWQMSPSCMT